MDDARRSVHLAIERGVNFFDTSDIYGLGASETNLGQALQGYREKVVIATKFGVRYGPVGSFYDNSIEWIDAALNDSLKRLQTDYIDIYQVHPHDGKTPIEDVFEHLEKLRASGKIRYFGISNINQVSTRSAGLLSFQLEYSLVHRSEEANIATLQKMGLTFLGYGSLGQGILSGKYDRNSVFGKNNRRAKANYLNFKGRTFFRNLKIFNAVREIADNSRCTVPQVALNWILQKLPSACLIVGVKSCQQLLDNLGAFECKIDPVSIAELTSHSDPL